MNTPPPGLKKQVLGIVLICLGLITAILADTIGFKLDGFYSVITMIGVGLFIHGYRQNRD